MITRENRAKITDLWFEKNLQNVSNEDMELLKYALGVGFVPMSDYFDSINRITWNDRILEVKKELETRGL